jgi:hypothetical protein
MRPNFQEVAGLWERDGSLRDIYVHDVNAGHWDCFDRLLSQHECTYTYDGVTLPFPGSHSVLADREGSHSLAFLLSGPVVICCYFFTREQLELDISPSEITGPLEHEQVLLFVENLAEALRLPAEITPENCEQSPFLTYRHDTKSWRVRGDSG